MAVYKIELSAGQEAALEHRRTVVNVETVTRGATTTRVPIHQTKEAELADLIGDGLAPFVNDPEAENLDDQIRRLQRQREELKKKGAKVGKNQ
jgi:hypothetical protein